MGYTLVVKQCLRSLKALGSNPIGIGLRGVGRKRDTMGNSFRLSFALTLSALLGIPENAGMMQHFRPLVGPTNSDFVPIPLGFPENAGVM